MQRRNAGPVDCIWIRSRFDEACNCVHLSGRIPPTRAGVTDCGVMEGYISMPILRLNIGTGCNQFAYGFSLVSRRGHVQRSIALIDISPNGIEEVCMRRLASRPGLETDLCQLRGSVQHA